MKKTELWYKVGVKKMNELTAFSDRRSAFGCAKNNSKLYSPPCQTPTTPRPLGVRNFRRASPSKSVFLSGRVSRTKKILLKNKKVHLFQSKTTYI